VCKVLFSNRNRSNSISIWFWNKPRKIERVFYTQTWPWAIFIFLAGFGPVGPPFPSLPFSPLRGLLQFTLACFPGPLFSMWPSGQLPSPVAHFRAAAERRPTRNPHNTAIPTPVRSTQKRNPTQPNVSRQPDLIPQPGLTQSPSSWATLPQQFTRPADSIPTARTHIGLRSLASWGPRQWPCQVLLEDFIPNQNKERGKIGLVMNPR
jgi:hypothetical protein